MLTEAVLKIASGKRRELVSCSVGGQWRGKNKAQHTTVGRKLPEKPVDEGQAVLS